ncbi:hypothetical protein ACTXT7_011975 [Hymenolepis weldensis]
MSGHHCGFAEESLDQTRWNKLGLGPDRECREKAKVLYLQDTSNLTKTPPERQQFAQANFQDVKSNVIAHSEKKNELCGLDSPLERRQLCQSILSRLTVKLRASEKRDCKYYFQLLLFWLNFSSSAGSGSEDKQARGWEYSHTGQAHAEKPIQMANWPSCWTTMCARVSTSLHKNKFIVFILLLRCAEMSTGYPGS